MRAGTPQRVDDIISDEDRCLQESAEIGLWHAESAANVAGSSLGEQVAVDGTHAFQPAKPQLVPRW